MKVLVISDNHGSNDYFRRLTWKEAPFDMLIHAGDSMGTEEEMERIAGMPLVLVQGNCDGYYSFSAAPIDRICYIGRVKTFLTHGHRYDAHRTGSRMAAKARSEGCRIAIFGHTHIPGLEWVPDGQCSRWLPDDDRDAARYDRVSLPAGWNAIDASEEAAAAGTADPTADPFEGRQEGSGKERGSVGRPGRERVRPAGLAERASGARADLPLGGEGLLLMNPGSLERPRQRGRRPSYLVIDIANDGALTAEIRYL